MKRTYEERLNYELSRRNDRHSQHEFFNNAIGRIMYDSTAREVIDDKQFACDVLCHTGFCLYIDCTHCVLEQKFNDAMKDFALKIR